MEFFDVIHTQRSIRKFKPDAVPEEAIRTMVDAAIRAPSGGNTQPWGWLIVRDPAKRKVIADHVLAGVGDLQQALAEADKIEDPSRRRMRRSSITFRSDVMSAPVLIIPCLVNVTSPTTDLNSIWAGSSIYGAVQNLMLAARAQGLGTVLTTFNTSMEDKLRQEFGLPENAKPVAVIPLGYPAESVSFGPTTRKPAAEVTFWDGWGNTSAG